MNGAIVLVASLLFQCTGFVSDPGVDPRVMTDPNVCIPGIAETSRVPRLTNKEYDNTIRDLLYLDVTPSTMLAPDSNGSVDRRAWDAYVASAERLAAQAMTDADARARLIPCTPSGDGSACAATFITAFGRRALRRPITTEEQQSYLGLYQMRGTLTENGTFDEGVQLLLEAFLQSPSFLLRAERSIDRADGRIPLSDHEIAVRLSYMLWSSMPDDALLTAADEGRLSTDEEIRTHAARMLGDPRARAKTNDFHRVWLGIDGSDAGRWADVVRDPGRFPEFDPAVVPTLSTEATRFIEHVVFDLGGGLDDILTSPIAMVNAETAALYGLDPADFGASFEPVSLDPAQRSGIFTRVGFLTAFSMYDRTSPILRGAFIQKHILCAELGSPPPGAEMTPLPPPNASLVTTRDRVTAQTSANECTSCHRDRINPIGFSLEHFDAIGRWRDTENGAPIDATGTAPFGDDVVAFDGPLEMANAVTGSDVARTCYAVQWVSHAYQRPANSKDRCVANGLAESLADETYSVTDLMVDLTQAETFRYRSTEVTP